MAETKRVAIVQKDEIGKGLATAGWCALVGWLAYVRTDMSASDALWAAGFMVVALWAC